MNEDLFQENRRLEELTLASSQSTAALQNELAEVRATHSNDLAERDRLLSIKEQEVANVKVGTKEEELGALAGENARLQGEFTALEWRLRELEAQLRDTVEENGTVKNEITALSAERDAILEQHGRAGDELAHREAEWRRHLDEMRQAAEEERRRLSAENHELATRFDLFLQNVFLLDVSFFEIKNWNRKEFRNKSSKSNQSSVNLSNLF